MAENRTPARVSRPLLGVLYMCVACALFPIMTGIVKLLAVTYEPTQIVWFRIVVHLGLVALVFTPRMGLDLFRTQRIGLQFLSSVMMLLSTLLFLPICTCGLAPVLPGRRRRRRSGGCSPTPTRRCSTPLWVPG